MSDRWLIDRSHALLAIVQRSQTGERGAAVSELDALVEEARRRHDPKVLAMVLRVAAIVRLITPQLRAGADLLLDELLQHTREHSLLLIEADAYALRAARAFLDDPEGDTVLDEIADAMAILEDAIAPGAILDADAWPAQLPRALTDTAVVLDQLDLREIADVLLLYGLRQFEVEDDPHGRGVYLRNRARLLLTWGLQLERAGEYEAAAARFATAAGCADQADQLWSQTLFPHRPDVSAADEVAPFAAAHAMHRPGGEHIERLSRLRRDTAGLPEPELLDIALARCLERASRRAEAIQLLEDRTDETTDPADATLRLALARQLALLREPAEQPAAMAWRRYATELEAVMTSMQRTRMTSLRARIDHAKLRRQHGTLTRQALQDPLTGLSNRRALEQRLQELVGVRAGAPLSVAMLDLDGFKQVNDRYSHAAGDDVLRAVTRTLRDALRTEDAAARYGGDEFVVLLPSTPLGVAAGALSWVLSAVTGLPRALSRGVTASIGVTYVIADDTVQSVLTRADAAMYQAKRRGGGQVVALPANWDRGRFVAE
jgi:diguanylate cyclase (GGDEF)-like protein